MESSHPKSFFERYQSFVAIIICGLLVAGGIIVTKFIPAQNATATTITQESVRANMIKTAGSLNIDKGDFATCLDSKRYEQEVTEAVALAQKSGVSGTPTFFVIKRTFDDNDRVISETQTKIIGAQDQDAFEQVILDGKEPAGQEAYAKTSGEKIILTETDHWFGPKHAAVIIVEYSDIDCPFCKKAKPTIERLLANNPEYAYVYRHSPIVSLHPFAAYKAQGTECAYELGGYDTFGKEDAFWRFLDIMAK